MLLTYIQMIFAHIMTQDTMILPTDVQNSQVCRSTLDEADSALMKQTGAEQDTGPARI